VKKPQEKGLQHCGFCHKKGHHESVCKAKVKARMDDAQDYDGREACANLLIVASPKCLRVWASEGEAMQGRERFYADSGANKHLHPEATAAATFTSHAIDVNTAEGTRAFKTDGMGAMDLETPNGDSMPGFEQVLFAKHTAERLCSIPELCEAGLVCVFDAEGMKTYKRADYECNAEPFTEDGRDAKMASTISRCAIEWLKPLVARRRRLWCKNPLHPNLCPNLCKPLPG